MISAPDGELMDPISNVDMLVALLRQRLLERSRTGRAASPRAASDRRGVERETLHTLAAIQAVDDHQLGRALIQSVLTEHFGAQLINEARFQQVVDRVTETLEGDADSARILNGLLRDLRTSAR